MGRDFRCESAGRGAANRSGAPLPESRFPGRFSDDYHRDHLHIGYSAPQVLFDG